MRPLDIRLLNLSCCGVEAAAGVELWRGAAIEPDAVTGGPLAVLVIAGTITVPGAPAVTAEVEELPDDAVIVSFGACSISGGPYWDSPMVVPGLDAIPAAAGIERVDVPGCPPTAGALAEVLTGLATGARVGSEGVIGNRGLVVVRS